MDCMISLPGQLFYSVQIPVCLWFLTRSKSSRTGVPSRLPLRDRQGETLFIDARKFGTMVDRTHKELTVEDLARIASTYHSWRGEPGAGKYADVPGFCKSVKLAEITTHGHVLTPCRYVGAEEAEDDAEPFDQKMKRLTGELEGQFGESARLEKAIRANLKVLGFYEEIH